MFSLSLSRRYKQPRESTEPLYTKSVPYEPAGRRALVVGRETGESEVELGRTMSRSSSTDDVELLSDQAWLEKSATVLATQKGARFSCAPPLVCPTLAVEEILLTAES